VPGSEAVPNFLRVCLHMTGKTLKDRPEDAARFLAAEMEGLRYAASHRDETIKLTHDITGAKADDPRPAFVYDWAVKVNAIGTDLPIPMDKLDYIQQMTVSVGSMAKPIDLTKVVDPSAREKALQLLAGH
jgi:ABC-type nitrate/sulfonate/bicarbonate transport system substrate-binding protein